MPPRTPLICCFSERVHGRRLRQHGDFQRGLQVPAAQQEQEAARPGPLQVCPRLGPSREAPAYLLVQNLGGALSPLQLASQGPDELACDHGATPGFCPEMWFSRF